MNKKNKKKIEKEFEILDVDLKSAKIENVILTILEILLIFYFIIQCLFVFINI